MRKNNIFDSCHLPTMIFSRPRFHERDAWAAVKGVWSSLFALRPWVSLAKASLVCKGKNLEHGTPWSLVLTETTSTESTMFEKMLKLNSYWSFRRNRVVSHKSSVSHWSKSLGNLHEFQAGRSFHDLNMAVLVQALALWPRFGLFWVNHLDPLGSTTGQLQVQSTY